MEETTSEPSASDADDEASSLPCADDDDDDAVSRERDRDDEHLEYCTRCLTNCCVTPMRCLPNPVR